MSEATNTAVPAEGVTTKQAAAVITEPAKQEPATQQPAVDVDAITAKAAAKAEEAAQKKMEGVFKSMLEQQGLDAATISKMTDEWKSKQVTPEKQMQELQDALDAQKADNDNLNRQITAIGKGIAADKAPKYIKLAESYLDDSGDFSKALDAALVDFPIQATPPQYAAEPGSNPMLGMDKSLAGMGYKERVAFKRDNPKLYEELAKQEEK